MLGGFYLAGLLLSFTPCVLPMVPILSGIIVGAGQGNVTTGRAFALSLSYVLGMALHLHRRRRSPPRRPASRCRQCSSSGG